MKQLKIADGLTLPLEVMTQSVAIVAKKRVGKSYTMRKISEQILMCGQQLVLVDPKGDQWGIRSSADGKRPGFPILILGGEHGDLPLEKQSGELVAKLVVEEQVSVVLDLSAFRKYEVAVFMTDFLENIYRLKAQEKYRTPVTVVIDEADMIAPQMPQKGEERMLGAADDLVRRGGQRGIGVFLVTQRTAVLNKNVLTQSQMLVVLRTIAPQDLKAMNAWIDVHGEPEQRKILMESLPSLPIGDAWFWSPGWPTEQGIFKRVHVLPIETFDSAATPKVGEKRIVPKNLADVDLESLKGQMAATIEKAKADDPKLLHKEIVQLRAEIANRVKPVTKEFSAQDLTNALTHGIQKRDKQWREIVLGWKYWGEGLYEDLRRVVGAADLAWERADKRPANEPSTTASAGVSPARHVADATTPPRHKDAVDFTQHALPADASTDQMSGPEQRVLEGVARLNAAGVQNPSKPLVAVAAKYSVKSSSFIKAIGKLRMRNALDDQMRLHESVGAIANPITQDELHSNALSILSGPESRVLTALLRTQRALQDEELAQAAEYSANSSSYIKAKGKLRSKELLTAAGGSYRAADILFI